MSGELIRSQLPTAVLYDDTGALTDFAHIDFNDNAGAMTIDYQHVWHLVTDWDTNEFSVLSTPDQANNRVIFAATKAYGISFKTAADVAGAPATFTMDGFCVCATPITVVGITKANPGVVETATAHGLLAGDHVKITGCTTMTEPNNKIWFVGTVADPTHFELHTAEDANVNTGAWGVYDASSGEMTAAERTCAWTENKYTNGVLSSKAAPPVPCSAVAGSAFELYARNKTGNGNVTLENGCLTVRRW